MHDGGAEREEEESVLGAEIDEDTEDEYEMEAGAGEGHQASTAMLHFHDVTPRLTSHPSPHVPDLLPTTGQHPHTPRARALRGNVGAVRCEVVLLRYLVSCSVLVGRPPQAPPWRQGMCVPVPAYAYSCSATARVRLWATCLFPVAYCVGCGASAAGRETRDTCDDGHGGSRRGGCGEVGI